uniref:Secreted protein n=1 Tax=Globodera pallida TaxID=36090 RepID=A0A183CDY6_GLOPA
MSRSPVVPLLFLIAIFVPIGRSLLYDKNGSLLSMTVKPAEALPNETISSPEVQLQQVPGPTSSVPNDNVTWTELRQVFEFLRKNPLENGGHRLPVRVPNGPSTESPSTE